MKVFAVLGMVFSLIVAILGFAALGGSFGGKTGYADSAPYSYSSGYAKFGADFYTYVANNAEEAASASRTAADNVHQLAKLVRNVTGALLCGIGLIGFCAFGVVFSFAGGKKKETPAPAYAPAYAPGYAPAAPGYAAAPAAPAAAAPAYAPPAPVAAPAPAPIPEIKPEDLPDI